MLSTLSLKEVLKVYAESETFQTTAKSTGEYEKKGLALVKQFLGVPQELEARFECQSRRSLNKTVHFLQSVAE